MRITEVNILEAIKRFGIEKRIFQREAQFQFELAWELQKEIGNDGKVLLEVASCTRRATANNKSKRFYSDIILKDDNGFIVIELKYKTKAEKDLSIYNVELTSQGAQDEGRYDYLWDIKRIELFKNRNTAEYDYLDLGNFLGGYAIILTNDNQYWEKTKEKVKNDDKQTVDLQFCIGQGDSVEGAVDWNIEEKKDWMKSRPEIKFDGCYEFNWNSYYSASLNNNKFKSKEFKYLITHIK